MKDRASCLASLCVRHQVDLLYAFGSRAVEARDLILGITAELKKATADLDIGARTSGSGRLTVGEKVRLALDLEELFGVPRADVVMLAEADPFLAVNIIRGERLYCADAYSAEQYELYLLRRAGDLAPLERERLALLESR